MCVVCYFRNQNLTQWPYYCYLSRESFSRPLYPWWKVDLKHFYHIAKIHILSRTDNTSKSITSCFTQPSNFRTNFLLIDSSHHFLLKHILRWLFFLPDDQLRLKYFKMYVDNEFWPAMMKSGLLIFNNYNKPEQEMNSELILKPDTYGRHVLIIVDNTKNNNLLELCEVKIFGSRKNGKCFVIIITYFKHVIILHFTIITYHININRDDHLSLDNHVNNIQY